MKKLYKRILAVALCLALTAALVPATVFAWCMDDLKPGDIVPGRVVVGLKEVYSGDPAELFTYLEIKSIEDMYLSVIISSGKTPEEVNGTIREMIGTTFVIDLVEETEEAVYEAVALLTADDRVKYAEPDHVVGPDVEEPDDKAPADLFAAFAEYFSELYSATVTVSDVGLYKGYGWFGGCYLANLHANNVGVIDDYGQKFIGGYSIHAYQDDDSMILYKEGKAYSLRDAYEKGIIAEEDFARAVDALNIFDGNYGRLLQSKGTVSYALAVLRTAAKLAGKVTPLMLECFDSDCDGTITVADALFALRVAAGLA